MIRLVAYRDHTNSGRRNQVRPGARSLWVVTMKLMPLRIEEKPTMPMPISTVVTALCEYRLL